MNDTPTTPDESDPLTSLKQTQRRRGYAARKSQPQKDAQSRLAISRLIQLDVYTTAGTVLWYVDCRTELRTQWFLPTALASGKRIVVPYCTVDADHQPQLGLWQLRQLSELQEGRWQILEPPPGRWQDVDRHVAPAELDVIVVPGVSFSRSGTRLGNGQGYYDRLLAQTRSACTFVGLCFERQIFDDLTVGEHDVCMHWVVTNQRTYAAEPRHA